MKYKLEIWTYHQNEFLFDPYTKSNCEKFMKTLKNIAMSPGTEISIYIKKSRTSVIFE